jgi:HK97 family phage prohead protease
MTLMTALKTKEVSLSLKEVSDDGAFEGYGSIFGNVDSYGDIVMPGAFTKSLGRYAKDQVLPLMLWQHNPDNPIGVWESMEEDRKGLRCRGRFLLDVQSGREAYVRAKAGAVRGLSIGYREIKAEPDGNTRKLAELDLYEVSVVSFAANRRASITAVKSESMEEFARRLRDGDPMPIKEFEDILREAGVPKSMATAIASHGYAKAIRSESEGEATTQSETALKALRAAVDGFKTS